MSYNVQLFGTPAGVIKALDEYGDTLTGQSQAEFLEAKPHLQSLVGQNVGDNLNINLSASGHASFVDGAKSYGNCSVKLEIFYAKFCQ